MRVFLAMESRSGILIQPACLCVLFRGGGGMGMDWLYVVASAGRGEPVQKDLRFEMKTYKMK